MTAHAQTSTDATVNALQRQVSALSTTLGSVPIDYLVSNTISELYERVYPVCSTVHSDFATSGTTAAASTSGSGCFITFGDDDLQSGLFLACAHLILRETDTVPQEATYAYVENPHTKEWVRLSPSQWWFDGVGDVALFRTNIDFRGSQYTPLRLASTAAKTGSHCVIFGDPKGFDTDSASYGVVRSGNYVNKPVSYQACESLLVTAPALSGNSGSPITNLQGEIIGILTFGYGDEETLGGGINLNGLVKSLAVLRQFRDNKDKKFLGLLTGVEYPQNIFQLKAANPSMKPTSSGLLIYLMDTASPFVGKLAVYDIILSAKVYSSTDTLLSQHTFGTAENEDSLGVLLYAYDCAYILVTYLDGTTGQTHVDKRVDLNKTYANVSASHDMFLSGTFSARTDELLSQRKLRLQS